MWFRTALLLIFWLLVYRLVMGVLRQLSAPRNAAKRDAGRPAPPRPRRPEWEPSDVIDVPFHAGPPDAPESHSSGERSRAAADDRSRAAGDDDRSRAAGDDDRSRRPE